MWPGQGLSIQYDEILHNARSDFQHVVVMQTKAYGKVLLLDGEWTECMPAAHPCWVHVHFVP